MAQATRKVPRYLWLRGRAWDSRVHLLCNLRKAPSLFQFSAFSSGKWSQHAKLRELERGSKEDVAWGKSWVGEGRTGGMPHLSCKGPNSPPSPHYLQSHLLWPHNSLCGPLLTVPTPSLEVVQSQMERSMVGQWVWQSRQPVVLRKGDSSGSMGSGKGAMRERRSCIHIRSLPFHP